MERKSEINFSLMISISFFLHVIILIGVFMPRFNTFFESKRLRERLFGGRDIIVNINQDDQSVINRKTLLSDRDSSAKGYITRDKGDHWLNNSLDFLMRRGSRRAGKGTRDINSSGSRDRILLADDTEVVVSIMKYDLDGFNFFGDEGEEDFNRIPDRYNFSHMNAIFYSNDGRFSFNTKKFKNFKYFKDMKDKIASNWYPPLIANAAIGGYAPGRLRIMAIPSQEVKLFFTMNRRGDVLDVVIVESLGNRSLDSSCVDSIRFSKNFGEVPDDIKGGVIVIPFIFGYYVY
jgi:TonB family protein